MIFTTPPNLPQRLHQKIEAVRIEVDDAYAADELVELGEEILSQLAAMGIAVYLQQAKQKEVFNDFLISLFLSNGHAYNAGPLYRWAANMIKDAEGTSVQLLKPFFWQTKDGKEVLNEEIHHLASLRNAVMHGFFVLPPERNREEAQKMEAILAQMNQAGLFEKQFGTFHFVDAQGFNGHWNISETQAWSAFDTQFAFGQLAERVAHEYAPSFRTEEHQFAFAPFKENTKITDEVAALLQKGKGALVAWNRPGAEQGALAYKQFIQQLDTSIYHPVYYVVHPNGATFTASFLEQELAKGLFELTNDEKALKDPWKFLKAQKGKLSKKIVVVLHDVHIALFSPNHLTILFNAFYDAEIPVLATAWHYPYLKRFFNSSVELTGNISSVQNTSIQFSLHNYLRFKGPSEEQEAERLAYTQLKEITSTLQNEIEQKQSVVARRFADENKYPIEFVHEAFGILSPLYTLGKKPFIQDEVDELYGFPKTIEESSRIFLTLGRRDIKLEYQHKVLAKNIQE
jgi:hypothetical protein